MDIIIKELDIKKESREKLSNIIGLIRCELKERARAKKNNLDFIKNCDLSMMHTAPGYDIKKVLYPNPTKGLLTKI